MEQAQLTQIYDQLKALLMPYEAFYQPKINLDSRYDLWAFGDFEVAGRRRKEIFFAGLIIQSSYVGFYFMPVYADEDLKDFFKPELLKCLKGKSCFHVKHLDEVLVAQIQEALSLGHQKYLERSWISA